MNVEALPRRDQPNNPFISESMFEQELLPSSIEGLESQITYDDMKGESICHEYDPELDIFIESFDIKREINKIGFWTLFSFLQSSKKYMRELASYMLALQSMEDNVFRLSILGDMNEEDSSFQTLAVMRKCCIDGFRDQDSIVTKNILRTIAVCCHTVEFGTENAEGKIGQSILQQKWISYICRYLEANVNAFETDYEIQTDQREIYQLMCAILGRCLYDSRKVREAIGYNSNTSIYFNCFKTLLQRRGICQPYTCEILANCTNLKKDENCDSMENNFMENKGFSNTAIKPPIDEHEAKMSVEHLLNIGIVDVLFSKIRIISSEMYIYESQNDDVNDTEDSTIINTGEDEGEFNNNNNNINNNKSYLSLGASTIEGIKRINSWISIEDKTKVTNNMLVASDPLLISLASEVLLNCLIHSTERTVMELCRLGFWKSFLGLLESKSLLVQKFAMQVISETIDLIFAKKQSNKDSDKNDKISNRTRRRNSQISQNAGINYHGKTSNGKIFNIKMTKREFGAILCESNALPTITWMLHHQLPEIRKTAQKVLRMLRFSGYLWVSCFIEQGCIPIMMTKLNSLPNISTPDEQEMEEFTSSMLEYLQLHLMKENLYENLIALVAGPGHQAKRSNIAIAIIFLSMGAPQIRDAFVEKGALKAMLTMLHNMNHRESAISFIRAIDCLIVLEEAVVPWDKYVDPNFVANEEDDFFVSESSWRHRVRNNTHLQEHDLVVLIQEDKKSNTNDGRIRKGSIMKMACPPASVLVKASPIFHSLFQNLINVPQQNIEDDFNIPTITGKYKIWEEIMAHIADPASFGRWKRLYKTHTLIDMINISYQYQLKELTLVYCMELRHHIQPNNVLQILNTAIDNENEWLSIISFRILISNIDNYFHEGHSKISEMNLILEKFFIALLTTIDNNNNNNNNNNNIIMTDNNNNNNNNTTIEKIDSEIKKIPNNTTTTTTNNNTNNPQPVRNKNKNKIK